MFHPVRVHRVRLALGLVAAVATLLAVLGTVAPPARAEPPFRLVTQVVDRAGVLDEDAVRPALDDLRQRTGVQLFVVFVDSFDGAQAGRWADQTADLSGLGDGDYLLAVAVQDRSYGYSAPAGADLSDEQLERVAVQRIEPRLAADDWEGAVEAAALGYRDELTGDAGGSADSGGGGIGVGLPVLLLGGAAAVGAIALVRRRTASRRRDAAGPDGTAGQAAEEIRPALTTEELSREASRVLVETDDAVRASEQELGFAIAEFGEARTASFSRALAEARQALRRGFTIQQQLADDVPEDEPERRRLLAEVIDLCTRADQLLDAEADRFDELRDVLRTAPARLDQALAQADELERRLPQAEAELGRLRERYAPDALARVEPNPSQARDRLEFVRESVGQGGPRWSRPTAGRTWPWP